MTKYDRAAKKYLWQVSSWLPCSGKSKAFILQQISDSLAAYREENPQADFAQIQAHFGDAHSVASAYVGQMDTAQLLKNLRLKRRIFKAVLAAVFAALLAWVGVLGWVTTQVNADDNGYTVVSGPYEK